MLVESFITYSFCCLLCLWVFYKWQCCWASSLCRLFPFLSVLLRMFTLSEALLSSRLFSTSFCLDLCLPCSAFLVFHKCILSQMYTTRCRMNHLPGRHFLLWDFSRFHTVISLFIWFILLVDFLNFHAELVTKRSIYAVLTRAVFIALIWCCVLKSKKTLFLNC